MTRILTLLAVLFANIANANIEKELNRFFDDLAYVNVTKPQVYDGQRAGLYTGGSLYTRMPVKNVQIMNLTMPSAKAGCGGIDLYTGSFSFINKDEFIDTAKSVMNNAKGYAFNIALDSMTPMLKSTLDKMQSRMDMLNQMNINSCETASALVDGVFNKSAEARKHACRDLGVQHSIFSDWAAARHGCNSEEGINKVASKASAFEEDMERLGEDINLAWYSMGKDKALAKNDTLRELLMNLTGTIIVKYQKGGRPQFDLLPSLVSNDAFLKSLLEGGSTQYYSCSSSDKKCLNPRLITYTVEKNNSIVAYVEKMLERLVEKSRSDVALDEQEISFLNSTTLPIYKMINVNVAFSKNNPVIDIASYSETIAHDYLARFIESNLNYVQQTSRFLQVDAEMLKEYTQSIAEAKKILRQAHQNLLARFYEREALIEKTKQIEKALTSQLTTSLSQNIQWAQKMRMSV